MKNEQTDVVTVDVKTDAIEITPEEAAKKNVPAPGKAQDTSSVKPSQPETDAILPEDYVPEKEPKPEGTGEKEPEVKAEEETPAEAPDTSEEGQIAPEAPLPVTVSVTEPDPNVSPSGNQEFASLKDPEIKEEPAQIRQPAPPARDFQAEFNELIAVHPYMKGKRLPEEVFNACMTTGRSVLSSYDEYLLSQLNDELTRLKAENETLRKNADNAVHAPVSASSGSSVTSPEDPFLAGFNSIY